MGDCSLFFQVTFSVGCLLTLIGVSTSSPRKMPVLFWMSVSAPIAVPVCAISLLFLMASFIQIFEMMHGRRDANRNQATAAVAAVQEQTLQPELREPPNTDRMHSFHISSLPTYIFDKEAVDHGPICPICKELFAKTSVLIQLPLCIHSFHKECLEAWLHRNLTCPVCRCRVDMEIPRDIALIIDQ